jgi:hypothetical protein
MIIIVYLVYFLILIFDANQLKMNHIPSVVNKNINHNANYAKSYNSIFSGIRLKNRNRMMNETLNENELANYSTILFKSNNNNSTLAKCVVQAFESIFKCDTPTRALFCKLNLNMSTLGTSLLEQSSNASFPIFIAKLTEFGQSLVREEKRSEITKYGLFPFRLNLLEMAAILTENTTQTIILNYVIPIYGSWNVLSLYFEKFAEAFKLDFRDVSCFSQLVSLLNEAAPESCTLPSSRRLSKFQL